MVQHRQHLGPRMPVGTERCQAARAQHRDVVTVFGQARHDGAQVLGGAADYPVVEQRVDRQRDDLHPVRTNLNAVTRSDLVLIEVGGVAPHPGQRFATVHHQHLPGQEGVAEK